MTGEDLVSAVEALKATEIKAELALFGATTAGVKAQLVERLTRCYELKREGKDVKAELRRRTLDRLGEAEEAKADAMRRRDARRRRAGGYERAAAAAAAKAPGGVLKAPTLKRSRGKGVPIASSGSRGEKNASNAAFVADVDLDEDKEDASEKYKLDNPLTGRRKLNVVRRDLDRQGAFQDTMTEEGWYMVAVPETREERAAELITALSGTPRVGGVVIDAWTPRAPAADFAVSESDALGKSRLDLLRLVPVEEEGSEKPFPGFILLRLSGMNQKLLGALEEVYPFKGFAVGGITRYGNTRKQKSEAPRTVPTAQLEQMMRACEPRVVSDEAFAEMQAEKKAREQAESLEHAMGEMEVASPEEVAAMREDADAAERRKTSARAAAPSEERASTAPPGAQTVEVHNGPFKGFKGYVTARRDDGSVDATLTIFGRETAVSLEASEFAFS